MQSDVDTLAEVPANPSSQHAESAPTSHLVGHGGASKQADRPDGVTLAADVYAKVLSHVWFAAWEYADRISGLRVDLESLDAETSVAIVEALMREGVLEVASVLVRDQRWRFRDEFMAHFFLRRLGDQSVRPASMLAILSQANRVNQDTIAAQQREHATELSRLHDRIRELENAR